ncbi:hypothetical protein VTL71DRAFT_9619 [Oculimacula yallundae]|uniref:Uncharacterized protein n=1 Tax=Oculimacula yallundae TaxID=86028 RepID=A0ABR4BRD5_9HELO
MLSLLPNSFMFKLFCLINHHATAAAGCRKNKHVIAFLTYFTSAYICILYIQQAVLPFPSATPLLFVVNTFDCVHLFYLAFVREGAAWLCYGATWFIFGVQEERRREDRQRKRKRIRLQFYDRILDGLGLQWTGLDWTGLERRRK